MCTGIRFTDNNGNMYFGRNLDWSVGYGQEVLITEKSFVLESAFMGEVPAKYSLVGMGIVEEGIPLYFDCGNEAGLAIAGLNFPGYAQYEDPAVVGGETHAGAPDRFLDGAARMSDGMYEKTIYTSGFSSRTKTYYFNTYDNPMIRSVKLGE